MQRNPGFRMVRGKRSRQFGLASQGVNLGSLSGLTQAVRVGVSCDFLCSCLSLSYNIWRPKNTDIAVVFIWLT